MYFPILGHNWTYRAPFDGQDLANENCFIYGFAAYVKTVVDFAESARKHFSGTTGGVDWEKGELYQLYPLITGLKLDQLTNCIAHLENWRAKQHQIEPVQRVSSFEVPAASVFVANPLFVGILNWEVLSPLIWFQRQKQFEPRVWHLIQVEVVWLILSTVSIEFPRSPSHGTYWKLVRMGFHHPGLLVEYGRNYKILTLWNSAWFSCCFQSCIWMDCM